MLDLVLNEPLKWILYAFIPRSSLVVEWPLQNASGETWNIISLKSVTRIILVGIFVQFLTRKVGRGKLLIRISVFIKLQLVAKFGGGMLSLGTFRNCTLFTLFPKPSMSIVIFYLNENTSALKGRTHIHHKKL